MKYCPRCKNTLPKKEFRKSKKFDDGLNIWCILCSRNIVRPENKVSDEFSVIEKYFKDGKLKIDNTDCFFSMVERKNKHNILDGSDIRNLYGVYLFYDWNDEIIRIGKAVKLRNRIISYKTDIRNYSVFSKMENEIQFVSVIYTNNETENNILENFLLQKYKPKFNTVGIMKK